LFVFDVGFFVNVGLVMLQYMCTYMLQTSGPHTHHMQNSK